MRYFTLLDFQHWALALCLGLLAVILIYIAWRTYPAPAPQDEELDDARVHTSHSRGPHPFPPILIFIYVGALLWALGYAVVRGLWGGGI